MANIEDAITAFTDVQTEVRSILRYEDKEPWDEFDNRQPANCVGFTALTSELLEERSIRHKIGFVNGHATIIALLDDGTRHQQWMFDSLSPKLNQNIDAAFSPMSVTEDDRDFAFVFPERVKTDHLDSGLHPADKYPWLTLEKPTFSAPDVGYSNGLSKRLILTLFRPEQGREIIRGYSDYSQSIDRTNKIILDTAQASQAILDMAGVFPDIDIRTDNPAFVRRIVKELSKKDEVQKALEVTEAFFDSFEPSNDTRVGEYKADCLRAISKISGKSEFAKRAAEIYEEIMTRPKSSTAALTGKLAVSQSMI